MKLSKIAVLAALLAPQIVAAQAAPYLPVGDIAYTYVDALMSRGLLSGLSVVERPYIVSRVRASLDSAAATGPSPVIQSFVEALSTSLRRYELTRQGESGSARMPFRAHATFDVFATGQSSGRRELMLADTSDALVGGSTGYFVMGGGHMAGSVRVALDNRLNQDPEFTGKKDRKINGRTEDAYLSGQWKYAQVDFGRLGRNWGPIGFSGLELGDDSYTYDHLYGRVGTDKFHITTVLARLENYVTSPGVESHRYFSVHRLGVHRGRFEAGLSEGYLYTGPNRGLEFSLLNPLNVFGLSWRNERTDGNLNFGADASWRTKTAGTYSAELLLDDIQIDRCDSICHEPSSYGMTFSAEGIPLFGDQRLFGSYTRVSSLAYRTPNVPERYASYGVGLGRGYSDYDEIRVGADVALIPRLPFRVYVAHRRQGEGDYRSPYPPVSDYGTTPAILSGLIWRANRAALAGAMTIGRDFQIDGEAGVNQNVNRMHIRGYDLTEFEGRVRMTWVPRWFIRFD
ncbi:MAG TPA: hypothetical protein VM053_10320 [Gemmatimonadaceae bacterium]|nr:hypothetical protein [Gemmatimonadaceae bacterium]